MACDGPRGADGKSIIQGAVDTVILPGSAVFPESITAGADGSLYVTSLGDGSVAKISPDRETVTTFIAAQTTQPIGKAGMLIDEVNGYFWVCQFSNDFSQPTTLDRYQLATGTRSDSHPLATASSVCNDIAMDAAGNLYVTDSFVGIERLPAGAAAGAALAMWSTDPLYQPNQPGAFAVNGIAIEGNDVYTNNLDRGIVVRTPITADGSAGPAVAIAGVTLAEPDGMRLLASHTLIVAESTADTLSKVVIDPANNTGVREVLSNRIDRPSAVVVVDGDAWVTCGQIARLFGLDSTPVNIPFQVQRAEVF